MTRPLIAISLGDPGGVGPEITAKALARAEVRAAMRPLVVGNLALLQEQVSRLKLPITLTPEGQTGSDDTIPIREVAGDASDVVTGAVHAGNGRLAYACIVEAAEMALSGRADGICTAPISKEAMFAAGFQFPGHTELLAELSGGSPVRMMLEGGGLHVVLQTIHVPLAAVPGLLTAESILETLRITASWGKRYIGPAPRIAVCGLNPHAGEGGHFGREDLDIILPAIEAAQAEGVAASGPHPADTVFHRAREGAFDLVIAMYHDQALIPVKTLDFHRGVNVTLGLPLLRTSPDHGTAFDIAGKGVANESSMVAALLRVAELARRAAAR